MKNNKKFIPVLFVTIFVLILFPSFIVNAADNSEAYKTGYSNGLWEGIDAAYSDLEDVKPKNYYKAMPKDADIISYYDLDKETSTYRTSFIRGYKDGFKEGYNTTYDNPKIEVLPTNYDEIIGFEMGKACGYSDYYANKNNRWANAVPSTKKLIELFELTKETNAYKNNFVTKFKEKFQEGYEYAYRYAKFEPIRSDIQRGEKDGEQIGGLLGANYGRKDYYDKNTIKWDRNLPSDNDIKSTFSLYNEVLDYEKSFIASFKKAYREKYNEAYRNANIEYHNLLFKNGYDNGKSLGITKGSANAKIDYAMGKPNSNDKYNFTNENITIEYNLHNENKRYRDGFIAGFNEGFNEGYIESYQSVSTASYNEKIVEETIPIGGGEVISGDSKLRIAIDNGTFYNDVIVSMDKYMQTKNTVDLPPIDSYTKNSDLYFLKISNPYNKYNDDKIIEISLEYYGDRNGGIYRYHYGTWQYLPTKITKNAITSYISPKLAQENAIYGVFIDEKAIYPLDIRGHWAKDEIITTLRRGYTGLYYDSTFRADINLTKVQLLLYLSKANNWKIKLADEDIEIVENLKDFNDIEGIKELVAYSIKEGFLSISKDNRFNPNDSISYKELEKIINKVYGNKDFTWNRVSDKMATIKDKRCNSIDSMNNKVTRAEFSYMLNLIND